MVSQNRKILIFGVIIAMLLVSWLVYRFAIGKNLEVTSPAEAVVWQSNNTYKITWNSTNIGRVGIVLLKGPEADDVKWIAQNVPARDSGYNWEIFVWEEPRQDYRIAVFEYPWQEGNDIVYSETFTILGPQFSSCDSLSIASEWPFVPSDFPDTRKIFITEKTYTGNLGRLGGADSRCQQEAQERGFEGVWKALLGDDASLAVDRLNLEGAFVMAESAASLPEGKSCHRLLGTSFGEFFGKLSAPLALNKDKFEQSFLDDVQNVWLGRVVEENQKECVRISDFYRTPPAALALNNSFTTTCQNWSVGTEVVPGYPPETGQTVEFPVCFTPTGVSISAVGLAGLSSGASKVGNEDFLSVSLGKSCALPQRLLCVEQ